MGNSRARSRQENEASRQTLGGRESPGALVSWLDSPAGIRTPCRPPAAQRPTCLLRALNSPIDLPQYK